MKFARALIAASAVLFASSAFAQEAATTPTLLPESINIPLIEGSTVPEDCRYPASITDASRFETACVTMPRFTSGEIAAEYIGYLGEQGWHQGNYISGGFTATRTDENNCQRVLNIFPSNFPPGTEEAPTIVMWFALDRTPRCAASQPG